MSIRVLLTALFATAMGAPAYAAFTEIDLSGAVNANVAIHPETFPVGLSMGNQGTGIPFAIAPFPARGTVAGTWLGQGTGSSVTVAVNAPGQASFYALLNNYYGTPGANEYTITIRASNNESVTYNAIGGVDTRDYNSNVFTNTIANTTTPWFDNGIGQRLDLREFNLPGSFLTETVASFTITQVNPNDQALFSGLTFSTVPIAAVPEPETYALMLAGLALLGSCRRRRKA